MRPWKTKAIAESSPEFEWQTRRLGGLKEINQEPNSWIYKDLLKDGYYFEIPQTTTCHLLIKPRFQVDEIVYIKEAWAIGSHSIDYPNKLEVLYKTTHDDNNDRQWVEVPFDTWAKYAYKNKWRSQMFMPEWAARLFGKIIGVRPERLQGITEEDAVAEGCKAGILPTYKYGTAKEDFASLWDYINPEHPWSKNEWVWVYSFKKVNHSQLPSAKADGLSLPY